MRSNSPTMKRETSSRSSSRKESVSRASSAVSVGKSVKHMASAATPDSARFSITSRTTLTGAPLSMSPRTRGDADSTPSAQATAPASRSTWARSFVRYFSGLRSVAHFRVEPRGEQALGELEQRLRRDRVLREIELLGLPARRERREVLDHRRDLALAVLRRPHLGEAVVAERALSPVAAAGGVVGEREHRREVAIERQAVEVGRGERFKSSMPCAER